MYSLLVFIFILQGLFRSTKNINFLLKKIKNKDYSYKLKYYGGLKLPLKFYWD